MRPSDLCRVLRSVMIVLALQLLSKASKGTTAPSQPPCCPRGPTPVPRGWGAGFSAAQNGAGPPELPPVLRGHPVPLGHQERSPGDVLEQGWLQGGVAPLGPEMGLLCPPSRGCSSSTSSSSSSCRSGFLHEGHWDRGWSEGVCLLGLESTKLQLGVGDRSWWDRAGDFLPCCARIQAVVPAHFLLSPQVISAWRGLAVEGGGGRRGWGGSPAASRTSGSREGAGG